MTHDDDRGEPYGRHHWQQLNQDYARAGLPPVMPEDWPAINAMAEQMDAVIVSTPGELDNNPLAQATAAHVVQEAVRPDHSFWRDLNLEPPVVSTDTRWCPDYDESDTSIARVRALVYDRQADSYVKVPLTESGQWAEVAEAYRYSHTKCQAHNHPDCQYFQNPFATDLPLTAYAIDRGENLVVLFVCETCRTRMDNPSWTDQDYFGRGDLPLYDGGQHHSNGPSED